MVVDLRSRAVAEPAARAGFQFRAQCHAGRSQPALLRAAQGRAAHGRWCSHHVREQVMLQRTSNLPATTNRPFPCGVAITISEVSGEIPVSARIVDPCDSITVLPLPGFREAIGLSLATCTADWSDRPNRLPSAGSIAGSRASASLDGSLQRHPEPG